MSGITRIRIFAGVVFAGMLWATVTASLDESVFSAGSRLLDEPWFVTTLFDTYFAFLTFWAWLAYKETSWIARLVWLALIVTLGNFAMATYLLIQTFKIKPGEGVAELLTKRVTA